MPEVRIAINDDGSLSEIFGEHNESFRFTHNRKKGEFELTFKPGLEEYFPGSSKVTISLTISEQTVREMASHLPPIETQR